VPVVGFGDGAGMGGPFGGEGPFHLGEQRQQQESDPCHAFVGGVDRQRVGKRADADAAFGKVVDEVEDFAEVAADPVKGVHHDHVAGPGVGQQAVEAVAVDGGAGLLVDVDLRVRDAGGGQRVKLPLQRLFCGGNARIAQFQPSLGVSAAVRHPVSGTARWRQNGRFAGRSVV
jgi:hypothetical protein